MKISARLAALFLFIAPSLVYADKRPPETLKGTTLEIPAHILAATGGVVESTSAFRDRGHFMSLTLAETFSGEMNSEDGDSSDAIHLEMGYGFFEFYSDRIPLYDVSLTVNGLNPVTNSRLINLGIQFKDDLSGFAEASVTQRSSGVTQELDVSADNFFDWTLGDENIPDGTYYFDFYFKDRAGNATVTPATASVTLDRVPPPYGSLVINNGNTITATPIVNLQLLAIDDRSAISYVRIANSTEEAGVVYPFIPPKMSIEWNLENSSGGIKTVYAWFRDGAGNWSVQPSSDTINLDQFEPKGRFTFVADGENIVEISSGVFQTKSTTVLIRYDWDPSVEDILRSIRISDPFSNDKFFVNVPEGTTTLERPFVIAPEDANDGPYTLTAVFFDLDEKESAPIERTIYLSRNSPPNPSLENLQIYSSSLTFVAQIKNTNNEIHSYRIDPLTFEKGASSATIAVDYATAPITFIDEGLTPNTPYSYTVRAFDLLSASLPGLKVEAVTQAEPPVATTTPQGVEINVIRISWGMGNNPAGTEVRPQWSEDSTFPPGETVQGSWSFQVPQDIEGLKLGTTYYFQVQARNSELIPTPFIDIGSTATLSYIQPQAPLRFFADQVTASTVLWKWIRNPSTEKGFQIKNNLSGETIADIPIGVSTDAYTYFESSGITPNSFVARSIYAYNFLDESFTRSASIATTVLTPPAPPSREPLSSQGSEITTRWGTNGNPSGTEYQAEIALNDLFTDQLEASDWIQDSRFTFRGLQPQTTYYARVRSRGQLYEATQLMSDFVNLGILPTQTFSAEREVNLNDGSAWKLYLPPSAVDQDFGVQMESDPTHFTTTNSDVIRRATEKAYRESNGYRFPIPGGIVEVSLTNVQGAPIQPVLKKQGQLTHFYQVSNPQAINSVQSQQNIGLQLPDPLNPQSQKTILAKTLRIWVLDLKTETWFRLPTNDVDLFLSQVEGGVQRFGIFSVMGAPSTEVDDVMAFPVPWRPNGPNAGPGAGQTGTEADGITFGNIPQEGTIQIIDIQGSLIKEIILIGNPWEPWDVKNTNGEKVTSGTYYWIAESAGNRKTGKLMVIR